MTQWLIGSLLLNMFPEFTMRLALSGDTLDILVLMYFFAISNYLIYYTVCEKLFKGYTLGKLITGTRAVHEDGDELTLRDAFLRSLCRLVPLEAFAALVHVVWRDKMDEDNGSEGAIIIP